MGTPLAQTKVNETVSYTFHSREQWLAPLGHPLIAVDCFKKQRRCDVSLPMPSPSRLDLLALATTLLDTIEFSVTLPDDELRLRVELFESVGSPGFFKARLWHLEHFRIQSTFPQTDGVPSHAPSDELILKEFEGFDLPDELLPFSDRQAFRAHVLGLISAWLDEQLGITTRPAAR